MRVSVRRVRHRWRHDLLVQGRSEDQRQLGDVEALAGHLLPGGSVFAFLARHRRELFPNVLFADLFGSGRGRPSVPADVVATVIVLQSPHVYRIVRPRRR
jgi:hypothetical protein